MRQPQPFFRQQTQSWYVQIGKEQTPLGKDKKAAWQEYHKLMAGQRKLFSADPVAFVVDEFLEWVQNHKAPRTYEFYQRHLGSFVGFIGKTLRVTELRPLNVTRWIAAKYQNCGDTTHNSAIGTVARALNWAVDRESSNGPLSRGSRSRLGTSGRPSLPRTSMTNSWTW